MEPRFTALALALLTATPATAYAQVCRGGAELPLIEQREIIGVWRLPPPVQCTRSIERVNERFFMVARCAASSGTSTSGNCGDELQAVSNTEYENRIGVKYTIRSDGSLIAQQNGDVIFEAIETESLWP